MAVGQNCGLPAMDKEAVEVGLKYVNNDACYPFIIVVGQLLKVLNSGEYDRTIPL